MSLEQVKKSGVFAAGDLLLYGALLVILTALLLLFTFGLAHAPARGILVSQNGEPVYTYVFGEGGRIADGWEDCVTETRTQTGMLVRIQTQSGFNLLEINLNNRRTVMLDSDCSRNKQCTHMAAVHSEGGAIVCVPHALTVTALGGENLLHPNIG